MNVNYDLKKMLELQDFSSIKDKILDILLKNMITNSNHIDFYTSNRANFVEKLYKITGVRASFSFRRINHNFPNIYRAGISFEYLGVKLSAGAAEYGSKSKKILEIKAIGEFLERFSARLPLDELIKNKYDIKKIKDNYPAEIKINSILNRESILVKRNRVYYGFKNEDRFIDSEYNIDKYYHPTTNGCAGHFNKDKAVISAWLEIVQRDGFLVYWLNSVSPKHISVKECISKQDIGKRVCGEACQDIKNLLEEIDRYNLKCYLLDITSDINIPNICCVIEDGVNGGKKIGMGASSGFNIEDNILNSMTEALSVFSSNYNKEAFPLDKNYKPFVDGKIGQSERLSFYLSNKNYEYFKFFINNKNSVSLENWASCSGAFNSNSLRNNTTAQLKYLKNIFVERCEYNSDYNVFVYEFKNKVLKAFDYKSVRVICRALYSLYLNENYADVNHPRLKEFIKNKNLENEAKLNIWPHPFP